MPIIHMSNSEAEAKALGTNVRSIITKAGGTDGKLVDFTIWLYDTHVGLCLYEGEVNGYHDSDFYMVVWDPVKLAPERIEFASTRGWCAPCFGSHPDATPEVQEAYRVWQAEQVVKAQKAKRHAKAERLANCRRAWASHGLPAERLRRVYKEVGLRGLEAILALYRPRVRSNFKLKLRAQVDAWAMDTEPQYTTPLSQRQLNCILPAGVTGR